MVLVLAEMGIGWRGKWFFRPRQGIGMTVAEYYTQFYDWKEEMITLSFPAKEDDYIDGFIEYLGWDIRLRLSKSKHRRNWSRLNDAFSAAKFEESMMLLEVTLKQFEAHMVFDELPSRISPEFQQCELLDSVWYASNEMAEPLGNAESHSTVAEVLEIDEIPIEIPAEEQQVEAFISSNPFKDISVDNSHAIISEETTVFGQENETGADNCDSGEENFVEGKIQVESISISTIAEIPVVDELRNDKQPEIEESWELGANDGSVCGKISVQDGAHKVFVVMSETNLTENLLGIESTNAAHNMLDERPKLSPVDSNAELYGNKAPLSSFPFILEFSHEDDEGNWFFGLLNNLSMFSTQYLSSEDDVSRVSLINFQSLSKLEFNPQVFDPGTCAPCSRGLFTSESGVGVQFGKRYSVGNNVKWYKLQLIQMERWEKRLLGCIIQVLKMLNEFDHDPSNNDHCFVHYWIENYVTGFSLSHCSIVLKMYNIGIFDHSLSIKLGVYFFLWEGATTHAKHTIVFSQSNDHRINQGVHAYVWQIRDTAYYRLVRLHIGLDTLRFGKFELGFLLSELNHLKQYSSSSGYDGVTVVKLQNFIWDPGQFVISFYILEDKNVFEGVGKDIVLMDTILEITMDSKALRKSSVCLLKQNVVEMNLKFCKGSRLVLVNELILWSLFLDIKEAEPQDCNQTALAGLGPLLQMVPIGVIKVNFQTFVWDPGLDCVSFRFSTLRTRCSFRGGICHDIAFYYKFYMYFRIFVFTYSARYDVMY